MEYLKFKDLAKTCGYTVDKGQFDKLEVYFNYLVEYNKITNLTAITERDEVFLLHFLDSMYGIDFIPQGSSVCDIGTGAGFPGVVLKIFRPDIKLTLVDSLNKRIKFLKTLTAEKLNIEADCIHSRAEDVGNSIDHREKYDIVVSRALAKLNTLYEYALPIVKLGGKFIAYKAVCGEELIASENVPKILGCKLTETKQFKLPINDAVRTLVVVEKTEYTNKIYPRGKNKERDFPLQ